MRQVVYLGVGLLLSACGYTFATHPSQCTAPTSAEAALTKSVWQTKD